MRDQERNMASRRKTKSKKKGKQLLVLQDNDCIGPEISFKPLTKTKTPPVYLSFISLPAKRITRSNNKDLSASTKQDGNLPSAGGKDVLIASADCRLLGQSTEEEEDPMNVSYNYEEERHANSISQVQSGGKMNQYSALSISLSTATDEVTFTGKDNIEMKKTK